MPAHSAGVENAFGHAAVSGNNKVFALSALGEHPLTVSVKCDPEESLALRAEYAQITPGYHLNKKHWVTIVLDGQVPDALVEQLIRDSHALVRPKVPRGDRPAR